MIWRSTCGEVRDMSCVHLMDQVWAIELGIGSGLHKHPPSTAPVDKGSTRKLKALHWKLKV